MENKYFVKFMENSLEFQALIAQRPTAFVLLAIIADRARKAPLKVDDGIEVGEAFIGDYLTYKSTPQGYRTDKKYLEKFRLVTFRTTNRGTIAKIDNSSIFDISRISSTSKLTDPQQVSSYQIATKQEVRSEKEEESKAKPMEKKDFFHEVTSTTPKSIVSEAYWDYYAPSVANDMDIEMYSDRYNSAREDWLKKAKVATRQSIKAFLVNANDWDQEQRY